MADFASMLKYLRDRDGLSQRDLADKLGISKSTISMYEMGKRHPKFEDEVHSWTLPSAEDPMWRSLPTAEAAEAAVTDPVAVVAPVVAEEDAPEVGN